MSSNQRYMPQQNTRLQPPMRQQYQAYQPPPPPPSLKENVESSVMMLHDLIERISVMEQKIQGIETKIDKMMNYMQNRDNNSLLQQKNAEAQSGLFQ